MLQAEMERIDRDTRMPDRLREITRALGDDPFLMQECVARPALVDHLVRGFYASDSRIHGIAREEAEALRARLVSGSLSVRADEAHRSELRFLLQTSTLSAGRQQGEPGSESR